MSLSATPINIGEIEAKNRFVMAPMVTKFATKNGEVTDRLIEYYRARAAGKAGTIIVEAAIVSHDGRFLPKQLEIHDDRYVDGLKRLSSAIKGDGAAAFIQLAHGGSRALEAHRQGFEVVSASSVALDEGIIPRALSREGLEEVKQSMVTSAMMASAAGFDGVEIHCAHLYLLSQFLSPKTNKREDEYGISRTRLVEEVIMEIKGSVGKGFPVICRINGYEEVPDGLTLEGAKDNARNLEKVGADCIHVSAIALPGKRSSEDITASPDRNFEDAPFVESASGVKSVVKVPVIAVGKITSQELSEKILKDGSADMIAIGRGYLADPNITKKWLEGRHDEVNECVLCNRCITDLSDSPEGAITCPMNPDLGSEVDLS